MRLVIAMALLLWTTSSFAQWYLGGNLHGSTLKEWKTASPENQLATMGDIVGKTLNLRDPILVKPKAVEVQACVNVVASNRKLLSQPVADTAVGCMVKLGYLLL